MVEQIPLTDEELEKLLAGGRGMRRGRVSYPILKMFIESGHKAVKLDIEGTKAYSRAQMLRQYAKEHNLPVKILVRQKQLYLVKAEEFPEEEPEEPIDITEESSEVEEAIEKKGEMEFK